MTGHVAAPAGGPPVRRRAAAFTGTRPLSDVLEHTRIVRAARDASLTDAAADCLYAVTDGHVTTIPVTRRTPKRIKFQVAGREHTINRDHLENGGYVEDGDLPASITGRCLYASPGLAEALLGEPLPRIPDYDWRDAADKARDNRRAMRHACYGRYHEQVDEMQSVWGVITAEEAAAIHDRIDAAVKADGYWDDGLPAQWWRGSRPAWWPS